MSPFEELTEAVRAICPNYGLVYVEPDEKGRGEERRIAFKKEATAGQRLAAQALFNAWDATAPVVPDPLRNLEPDQFWGVVVGTGREADLYAWIATIEDPMTRGYVAAKLKYAKYFERSHPLIEEARIALDMSSQELDDLWAYANS